MEAAMSELMYEEGEFHDCANTKRALLEKDRLSATERRYKGDSWHGTSGMA